MIRMKNSKVILVGVLLLSLALLTGCTNTAAPSGVSSGTLPSASADSANAAAATDAKPTATPQAITLPVFSAAELSNYNGQNSSPAYIAVNGKVYDVTGVPQWSGGKHIGRFQAGVDLSEEIMQSPHGTAKLDNVPIVGLYQP